MNSSQRRKGRREFRRLEHSILIDSKHHMEASIWCVEQFGKRWEVLGNTDGVWTMFWAGRDHPGKYVFHFAEAQDKMLFVLRWS
jgi:hypothetical protein